MNPAPEAPDAGQLGAVRNLAAAVRTSSILVSWEPPADTTGIAGYQAFALPGAEPQSSAGMISCITTADVRSCLIGVTAGQQYTVGVLAFDSEGNIGATDAWVVTDVVPAAAPTASVPAGNASLEGPSGPITTVTAGQKLTLVGKGYLPFSTVTLVVYSEPRVLGTVEADVNGEFTTEVTIPADLVDGEHSLVASGVDAYGNPYVLRTDFTVGSGVAAAAGGSTGGAALASTGASIAIPLIGGLVAVGVGGGLVVASRRRKTTV